MAPRIVIIGGGELPVGPEAAPRHRQHAVAGRRRDRAPGHRPRAAARDGRLRPPRQRPQGRRASRCDRRPITATRSRAPTTSSSASRPARSTACATTSRSRSGTASSSRSATPSAPAASCAPSATSRCSSTSRATWRTLCPDVWMFNITNPMTTLCRAVTRETSVKTVGLCHEITGAQFTLSQILDVDFRSFDFEVVGVNHLPIITKLLRRRRRRDGPAAREARRSREAGRRADLPARRDQARARRRRVGVHQARPPRRATR